MKKALQHFSTSALQHFSTSALQHFSTSRRYLFLVFILSTLASLTSCVKQQNDSLLLKDPALLLTDRENFIKLDVEEQKRIWVLVLFEYLSEGNLSASQKGLIVNIIDEIKSMEKGRFFLSDGLRYHAIALGKITPRNQFLRMFYPHLSFSSEFDKLILEPCYECIYDLENYVLESDANKIVFSRENPTCDCKWTCSQKASQMGCPGGDDPVILEPCDGTNDGRCCVPSSSGCGFMFVQACTGYVTCEP